jgi:hypothetical protein
MGAAASLHSRARRDPHWWVEQVRSATGSLVIIDNVNGKLTRSPATDEPTHLTEDPPCHRGYGDSAPASRRNQRLTWFQLAKFWFTRLSSALSDGAKSIGSVAIGVICLA